MRSRCCVLAAPPAAGKTVAIIVAALMAGEKARKCLLASPGVHSFAEEQTVAKNRPLVCFVVEPTKELVLQVAARGEALLGEGAVLHTNTWRSGAHCEDGEDEGIGGGGGGDDDGDGDGAVPVIKALLLEHPPGSVEAQVLSADSMVRLVVCTPERFVSPRFVQCLATLKERGKLGPVFIDEGHLIAQWGLVFRGSFLKLKSAIATAFQGGLGGGGDGEIHVMVLSGSINLRQAWQAVDLLGLNPARTDIFLHPLDRREIVPVVLDLNDVPGSRRDVLREGAKRMAVGCMMATRAIVFVATAADAKFVASVLDEFELLCAVPFYRRLDLEEEKDDGEVEDEEAAESGRAKALSRWRLSTTRHQVGVLVATVLAAHGLDDEVVDFTGHLDQRGDPRTLSQELGRACRKWQRSYGNWLARHPLLLTSAAFLVDFSDGGAAGAHRDMVALVEAGGGGCRRAHLLRLLGSPLVGECSGCDGCNPEMVPFPSTSYKLVDATAAACVLIRQVLESRHQRAWYVQLVSEGAWRTGCSSRAEANALFLRLYTTRVLDITTQEPAPGARALCVSVSPEQGAKVLNGETDVLVWAME